MLKLRNEFILRGKNNKEGILSQPYLNDQKELVFKCFSLFSHPSLCFILNENQKSIDIQNGKQTVSILLAKDYANDLKEMVDVKKKIINDLSLLGERLRTGKERLMVIDLKNDEYYFTSETIINNAQYSSKYNVALLYYVNQSLKTSGKPLLFRDCSEMQRGLNKAFLKTDLNLLDRNEMGGENCFYITIPELVELL